MSILFSPQYIGKLQVKNRFIHSATDEAMANPDGEVTDNLIRRYATLAKGEIGLIISGHYYTHHLGRAANFQPGIESDNKIAGISELVKAVQKSGSRFFIQLAHAGRQTTKSVIGKRPAGPSGFDRDKINMVKAVEMSNADIDIAIGAFSEGARRAVAAGVDGIQLHAAHGYLISQFLSPYFNRRNDKWGGSDEKRFSLLKEIVLGCRREMPDEMPLMVKMNSDDFTPGPGVSPSLAKKYAGLLQKLGVDGIELSCGTAGYSFMNLARGSVPVKEFIDGLPLWKKPFGRIMLHDLKGKFDLEEGYNLEAAKLIKSSLNTMALSVVGGFRRFEHMEDVIEKGYSDFISMSRPFIREPHIIKHFKEKKRTSVSCDSCNKCLAAVANRRTLRCYNV